MAFKRLGDVEEADNTPIESTFGVTRLGDVEPPSNLEVLQGVPERTGLSFIEAGGGLGRALGDLTGSESLSAGGAEMARTAKGATAESTPAGMNLTQEVMSSGLESALQMLPAMALSGAALPVAGIGLASAQTGGSRYSELRDAGFSGGRAALHSAIDALAEGLGEAVSLPVLAQTSRPFLSKLAHFINRDLVGEEATTVMQQANAMLSDNPGMTWDQFLQGMAMTALVTPVAAAGQVGLQHSIERMRGRTQEGVPPPLIPTEPVTNPPLSQQPDSSSPPAPIAVPPAPQGEIAPEPKPPADVTAQPPAPTGTPPATGPWHDDHGNSFWHPNSGGRVLQAPDGQNKGQWELSAGDGTPLGYFKTPEEAFADADYRGWNEQLPESWKIHQDGQIRYDRAPQYSVQRDPDGSWNLYKSGEWLDGPVASHAESFKNLNKALETYSDIVVDDLQISAGATPGTGGYQPPQAPPSPKPGTGFASMFETLPEHMAADKKYDPRLYTGSIPGLKIIQERGGSWRVSLPVYGIPHEQSYSSTSEAIDALAKSTGADIRTMSADDLTRLYHSSVLHAVVENPDLASQLSDEVNVRFGGQLQSIAQLSKQKAASSGVDVLGANETVHGAMVRTSTKKRTLVGMQPGDPIEYHDGTKQQRISQTDMIDNTENYPPGIYWGYGIGTGIPFRQVKAMLERLQKIFLPNARIVLLESKLPSGAKGVPGYSQHVKNNLFVISVARLTERTMGTNPALGGEILAVAAHEFGHAVIYQHLLEASPQMQAKLMKSWLEYTTNVTKDTDLHRYLLEHQFTPRAINPGEHKIGRVKGNVSYFLSYSEYLADQASRYFLHREEMAQFGNYHTSGRWYEALLDKLRQLFVVAGKYFKGNTTYYDWLDSLAGGKQKVVPPMFPESSGPTGAPVEAGDIKPKAKPTRIVDKGQATALIHRMGLMFDALVYAGATKEEVAALNPTGLIADFNWKAAYDLADKYGINPIYYGGKRQTGTIDGTTAFREDLQEMNRAIDNTLDPDIRHMIGDAAASVKKFGWLFQKTLTAVQLRKRFGGQIPGVKAFVDTLEKMFAYRSRWKEIADNRIKEMKGVSKQMREQVFNLLLEEDKTGNYASTITRDLANKRVFTLTEESIRKWKLDSTGANLYKAIRSDFDSALEEMEFQAEQELMRLYSAGPALTKALAELHDGFAQMKARPYVPHTRFGDHTVTVREGGILREFYQFDSVLDARRKEAELRASAGKDVQVSRGKMSEQLKVMMGMPPQLINAMKATLKLSPEQIGEFEDLLKDMSNGASFVRRFKRRKNVAGWLDDADNFPRAYADYMSRFANHVSRLKYNHILTASTTAVRGQGREMSKQGMNTVEVNDLGNWLERLQDYVNNPGSEFANARAAATLWYLGFNTKSALVNTTSVPMVTYPYLAKRFGDVRAVAEITKAYKDIAKQYARKEAMTQDERLMMDHLRQAGRIDASFASELAGLREGGRLSDQTALSKPRAWLFGMKYYGMWLFQKIEIVNREVTALAAYRLHRTSRHFDPNSAEGFDKKAAEAASAAVQDTQNENAQWNRAEFARGKKSILTMFMSYQQNIIFQMFGGDQAWMRMLAAQLMMAGLMGLPFAQDIDDLIKALARKAFGTDMNAEKAVRMMLKDTVLDADWAVHGLSHNILHADLSGSLSQGRVIPGVQALTMEGKFADRLANAATDVGGAGFSILLKILKGISSNDPDTWRTMSQLPPEFVRAMIEGGNMLAGGKALDAQGRLIKETSTTDGFLRSLGFQISDVQQEKGKRFAQRDTAAYWLSRREYVLSTWEIAVKSRDSTWRTKAMEALKEFNSEAPDRALKITSEQIRSSVTQRIKSDKQAELDLAPSKNLQQTYKRVGDLYD
jgi:hypothetical protein